MGDRIVDGLRSGMVSVNAANNAVVGGASARSLIGPRLRENLIGWAFILPAFIGFLVFYLVPTFRAISISLTDWNLMRAPNFIAFDNYAKLIHDGRFWGAVRVTCTYVICNIPIQTVLGLGLALLLDRMSKSVALRAVVITPYLLSNVVVALIWLWVLDPLLGIGNAFLNFLGFPSQPFLTSPNYAIFSIVGINIWRHTGLIALLFYAGLQAIPKDLHEAARLDGAGEFTVFRRITLPLLRPVLAFVVVTSVIGSFQIFDTIAVTTKGGPADSTNVIIWYIYENAFRFSKMGYASAISVVLFILLVGVTLAQMRYLRAGASDLGGGPP
jgi:multiple sugar transport system permease protein